MKSVVLYLVASFCLLLSSIARDQPNIIVIFTDDHGWPDVGAAGIYEDLKTPNIDQLAADGARCTNGYVTAPQCVPSRGGLLAGRDQSRFGLETNGSGLEGFNAEVTIAERMKAAGYATGQIGKWHLGSVKEIPSHGFDDVFAKHSAQPGWANFGLDGSDEEPGFEETGMYHLDACSAAATAFIDRHSEEPFFLYLAYRAPHVPLDAPEKKLYRFTGKIPERRRQALGIISAMDDGIGAVRAKLVEKELTGKTLIFFIGDNGAPLKIHKVDAPGGGPGWDGSLNVPMNGEKGMLSEGGIRVPYIVAWPGRIPAGQVFDKPVSSLDVAATSVAISGAGSSELLDGVNVVPHLAGEVKGVPHEVLFWRWSGQSAIREGNWKLLIGGAREYLYDIVADPGETTNLMTKHPEVAERLRKRLAGWTQELNPPGFIKGMATAWERYFDHYLDGKTVSSKEAATLDPPAVSGWIARNAELKVKDGKLRVHDLNGKARLSPFIANNQVKLKGPFRIRIPAVLADSKGEVSIAWRISGEKDFDAVNAVTMTKNAAGEYEALVPAEETVIHLRVRLPEGNATIGGIVVESSEGELMQRFRF
ncbi:MAG: sulfatase-like hydrolase/transferase [Verrucomicrobiales bacterium]|nr:sulfatase-like hydrolase/transferase [Verrucomicrobiales bacterium]